MEQSIDTVRERERERELYSSELRFLNDGENLACKENIKFKIKVKNIKRIGYYAKSTTKLKMLHNSLSFL